MITIVGAPFFLRLGTQVLLLQWLRPPKYRWQCVELFAGEGNLGKAFRAGGKASVSFDVVAGGKLMDFLSPAGFLSGPQDDDFAKDSGWLCGWSCAQARVPLLASYIETRTWSFSDVWSTMLELVQGEPWIFMAQRFESTWSPLQIRGGRE